MQGLYAIVDPEACAGRDPQEVAQAILRGGCAALQLRAKQLDDDAYLALALPLRQACSEARVRFVVNDRVWLAQRAQADAVHLGQGDMPLAEARQLLGTKIALGLSTHTLAQAQAAERSGADMIGFGPVFTTRSKALAEPAVGVEALAAVCASVTIPVIAIGGITPHNVEDIHAAGAPLAAAIAALCGASDPEAAARRMHLALGGSAPR